MSNIIELSPQRRLTTPLRSLINTAWDLGLLSECCRVGRADANENEAFYQVCITGGIAPIELAAIQGNELQHYLNGLLTGYSLGLGDNDFAS